MKKVFLLVIDGFGVGEAPDYQEYGDKGSNTFLNIEKIRPMLIPTLTKLGLKNIEGINLPHKEKLVGDYARLQEISKGKDSVTGHFEMMKMITKKPSPTFPNGFPDDVVKKIEKIFGTKILGNKVASGTQIIEELGEEHIKTKSPIIYTSADSVLQIATHTSVYSVEQLYKKCQEVRDVMKGKYAVDRIIARPFETVNGKFERLNEERKDFTLPIKENNTLVELKKNGFKVFAVGKINDMFHSTGITDNFPSHSNKDAIESIFEIQRLNFSGLVFVNLVDTDMLYGHRNNVEGYAECIEGIDKMLERLMPKLKKEDVLLISADHGNDPTTSSTDHSREFVPLLIYSKQFKAGINLGTIVGFDVIGKFIESYFKISKEKSFIEEILWKN